MRAILIGFMGSGKTTIGRLLADTLHTRQLDLDDAIVKTAGCSIAEIFAQSGEPEFRRLEHSVFQTVIDQDGILSTGGGTAVQPINAALMKRANVPVVLLNANDETFLRRVQQDATRPLVNQLDVEQVLAMKHTRQPQYDALADLSVDTDGRSPQDIAAEVLDWLGNVDEIQQNRESSI